MKTFLPIIFMFFMVAQSVAQEFELYAGPDYIMYNDRGAKDDNHLQADYSNKPGYSIGIGIDKVKFDWLKLRFTLQYSKYNSNINAMENYLGGYVHDTIQFNKSLLSLGIFPVNVVLVKNLNINAGLEFSYLVHEKFSGYGSSKLISEPSANSYRIEDKYSHFSNKSYFGIRGRVAYNIPVNETLSITPQYLFYFGCSNEFDQLPDWTKSMRHSFFIGINKKI